MVYSKLFHASFIEVKPLLWNNEYFYIYIVQ
jgi:hypothetical protein